MSLIFNCPNSVMVKTWTILSLKSEGPIIHKVFLPDALLAKHHVAVPGNKCRFEKKRMNF